jgi:hypothetical protein
MELKLRVILPKEEFLILLNMLPGGTNGGGKCRNSAPGGSKNSW